MAKFAVSSIFPHFSASTIIFCLIFCLVVLISQTALILVSLAAFAMANGYQKPKSYEHTSYVQPSYEKKHYETPTYDVKPKYEASYVPEKKYYETPSYHAPKAYHVPSYTAKAYSPPQPSYHMKAKAYNPQPSYMEKGYGKPKSYGAYSAPY